MSNSDGASLVSFFGETLGSRDPEVAAAVNDELRRQQEEIELIASENIVSKAVLEAAGSVQFRTRDDNYHPGPRGEQHCPPSQQPEWPAILHFETQQTLVSIYLPQSKATLCPRPVLADNNSETDVICAGTLARRNETCEEMHAIFDRQGHDDVMCFKLIRNL